MKTKTASASAALRRDPPASAALRRDPPASAALWRDRRGSRLESAVAQLFSLGGIDTLMKFSPIILGLSLLLTACSREDAKLAQKITGAWSGEAGAWTMTFAPDGSYVMARKSDTNILAGTWQIKDGDLIRTMTNVYIIQGSPDGGVTRCKIVSMDDHQLVYTSAGRAVTLSR